MYIRIYIMIHICMSIYALYVYVFTYIYACPEFERGDPGDGKRPGAFRFMWCVLISHTVFAKSFCKSQSPHKPVNLSFIIANIKNKWTDLCGN